LVGAPLGIRNHRSGAASGFWLAVIIIFIYMLLSNVLAITAQGGAIPAWVASFTPIVLGVAAGAYLTYIKNR
jgi:lipopolysaccharide export system permease protein